MPSAPPFMHPLSFSPVMPSKPVFKLERRRVQHNSIVADSVKLVLKVCALGLNPSSVTHWMCDVSEAQFHPLLNGDSNSWGLIEFAVGIISDNDAKCLKSCLIDNNTH